MPPSPIFTTGGLSWYSIDGLGRDDSCMNPDDGGLEDSTLPEAGLIEGDGLGFNLSVISLAIMPRPSWVPGDGVGSRGGSAELLE